MRTRVILLAAALVLPATTFTLRAAEPESADLRYFRELVETRNYSLGQPVSPQLTPDGKAVVFLRGGAQLDRSGFFPGWAPRGGGGWGLPAGHKPGPPACPRADFGRERNAPARNRRVRRAGRNGPPRRLLVVARFAIDRLPGNRQQR